MYTHINYIHTYIVYTYILHKHIYCIYMYIIYTHALNIQYIISPHIYYTYTHTYICFYACMCVSVIRKTHGFLEQLMPYGKHIYTDIYIIYIWRERETDQTYICVYTQTYKHICTCLHINIKTYTCIHILTYAYIYILQTYSHTYIHIHRLGRFGN